MPIVRFCKVFSVLASFDIRAFFALSHGVGSQSKCHSGVFHEQLSRYCRVDLLLNFKEEQLAWSLIIPRMFFM